MKSSDSPTVRKAQSGTATDPLTLAIHAAVKDALAGIKDELLEVINARPARHLVDRQELCNVLHVSPCIIRKLEDDGMPMIKLGPALNRYDLDVVMPWLASRKQEAGGRENEP